MNHDAVLEHVADEGLLWPRYMLMALLSSGIAVLGLLQNSVAVIIGAMLISPLMSPIVAMGMALAIFDYRAMRTALKTLVVGVLLALLIAILIVMVSPLQEATPEILARTEPTLFDLMIAVLAGMAGAYATITRKGEAIVGVAIATALMPPLAVAGYGIAIGNATIAGGAGFLFMTNLLAIALSVTGMARWYGFAATFSPKQAAWQASMIVGTFVLLSVPLGIALRDIAARGLAERTVRATLETAATDIGGRVTSLRVTSLADPLRVEAVLLSPRDQPRLAATMERTLRERLGRAAVVQLQQVLTADPERIQREQTTLTGLRDSITRLESTADEADAAHKTKAAALTAMHERALKHFGNLELLDAGTHARWRLVPAAGMDLVASQALETDLDQAGVRPQVQVIPALQPLPRIVFADNSDELDATATVQLEAVAWALSRWNAGAVSIDSYAGGSTKLARSRADAVANALRKLDANVADISLADQATIRAAVRSDGATAGRSVVLRIDAVQTP